MLLWPIGNGVVGAEYGDTYKHVWSFWHTDQVLFHGWPWTNKLSTPHGGFLLDVMLAPSILLLPVTWVFGPIVSSQLFVFLSLFVWAGVFFLWLVPWAGFTECFYCGRSDAKLVRTSWAILLRVVCTSD